MSARDLGLIELLAPESVDTFFRDYWEKAPLVVLRKQPDYYAGVFSTRAIDSVLCLKRFRRGEVRFLYPDRRPVLASLSENGLADLAEVQAAYHQGASVLLYDCEEYSEPIARLCRNVTQHFRSPVTIAAFLSPPGIDSSLPHFDKGDSFVLQLEGTKRWRVYEQAFPAPLPDLHLDSLIARENLPPLRHEVELGPGDLLYTPRGFVHWAQTSEHSSLHLTVRLRAYVWSDLLAEALAAMTQRHVALRHAVPPELLRGDLAPAAARDHFREMLRLLAEDANLEEGLAGLAGKLLRTLRPIPDDRLSQVHELPALTLTTVLRKMHGTVCHITREENEVNIEYPQNTVRGPVTIAPALHFIANAERFLVCDVPGLTDEGKLTLVRRLVKEGLLQIADGPDSEHGSPCRADPSAQHVSESPVASRDVTGGSARRE